jgi:hypothetical protein
MAATKTNPIKILNFGGVDYHIDTAYLGKYTAAEWEELYETFYAMLGSETGDADEFVSNIRELCEIFEQYPEGESIVNLLSGKSNTAHTHTVTAKGSVSQPTFTGTQATISSTGTDKSITVAITSSHPTSGTNYTPQGSIKINSITPAGSITGSQAFSGTASATTKTAVTPASGSHTHTVTAKGSISAAAPGTNETANYTPAGTISKPSISTSSTNSGTPSATADVASTTHTHSVSGSVSISKGTVSTSTPANYTPEGSVSAPVFTGTEGTVSVSGTPKGTVSQPTFTGKAATISVSGTPLGSVESHTHTVTLKNATTGSASGWSAGTLPTRTARSVVTDRGTFTKGSAAKLTADYDPDEDRLTVTFTANTPSDLGDQTKKDYYEITGVGTLPALTITSNTVAVNSVSSVAPKFTGSKTTFTGSYTPEGTVSQPGFTGSDTTFTGKFTPAGTNSEPTFTGTPVYLVGSMTNGTAAKTTSTAATVASSSHTHTYAKATGLSAAPTFTGTGVVLKFAGSSATTSGPSATVNAAAQDHTHSVTTTVDFTKAGFSGTAVTPTGSFTGTPAKFVGSFNSNTIATSGTYTPTGTVSKPTFTGSSATTSSANE